MSSYGKKKKDVLKSRLALSEVLVQHLFRTHNTDRVDDVINSRICKETSI